MSVATGTMNTEPSVGDPLISAQDDEGPARHGTEKGDRIYGLELAASRP